MKNFKFIILVIMLLSLLTGCMNQTNLKDLVVVEGIAIDDKSERIEMTIQILNTGMSSGTERQSGNMTVNVTQLGDTILEASSNLKKAVSREIFFAHNKVIVFGRKICEGGFKERIDYFLRSNDSRPDVAVCMADGDAKTIMENTENDAHVPVENIIYMIENGQKNGNSIYVNVEQMLNAYTDKTTQICIPVIKEQEDKDNSSLSGIAIFKGDKLAYVLNDTETLGFMLMSGKIENCIVSYNDEKLGTVGVELSALKVKNKARIDENGIYYDVKINSSLMINEIEKGTTSSLDDKDIKRICKKIEKKLTENCHEGFNACQEHNSDCVRVGEYLARDCPNYYEKVADKWDKYFKTVELNCDINVKLKKLSDNSQLD